MSDRWGPAARHRIWHKEGIRGKAHCDYRVVLDMYEAKSAPPADAETVCKRCIAISKTVK